MRVQGGGPLDGSRFDALAQGWVTATMTITQENLELAVAKLIATVKAAIYPNGDHAGGWQFLTETAGLSVHPATDRAGMKAPDQAAPPGPPAAFGTPATPGPSAGPATSAPL